jgi:hypothetical protein
MTEEKREKRARSIAAMGLVNREGDRFVVTTPSLRGKAKALEVRRDERGVIRCTCGEFAENAALDAGFRCEHILAVKFALLSKNTESVTKVSDVLRVGSTDANAAEPRMSERGEQEIETAPANISTGRQVGIEKDGLLRLADTDGEVKMRQNRSNQEIIEVGTENLETVETHDNVLDFSSTLKELRRHVDPNLVKQREGWRDGFGNVQMVDYVEWHTVADILDDAAPNWTHTVKDIRQIGDIMTVTVAITIDGVTREGIGTGLAQSEMGIKKAEHDALKRAAVKFGIARDLYKKESEVIEREGGAAADGGDDFPSNPIAGNLAELVTAKQLGMIRALARELGVDPDEESRSVMQCATNELSKRAASSLIQHLQDMQKRAEPPVPFRRAS